MHRIKSEKSRENHKCIFCAKTFTQARSLNEHIDAIHDTKKNYECNTCGILFSQKMSSIQRQSHEDLCLKKHLKAVDDNIDELSENENLEMNHDLNDGTPKDHIKIEEDVVDEVSETDNLEEIGHDLNKIHHQSKDTIQDDNDLEFSHNNMSKAVNDGQKKQKCYYCGKYFSEKRYLKTHIQIVHEGRKVHRCNECGKPFSPNVSLKQRKTHESVCLKKKINRKKRQVQYMW